MRAKEFITESTEREIAQIQYMQGECAVLALTIRNMNPQRFTLGFVYEFFDSSPDMYLEPDEFDELDPARQQEIQYNHENWTLTHAYVYDAKTKEYIDAEGRHKQLPMIGRNFNSTRHNKFPAETQDLVNVSHHMEYNEAQEKWIVLQGWDALDKAYTPEDKQRAREYAIKYLGIDPPAQAVAEDSEQYNGIELSMEIEKDDEYVDDDDYDNQTLYVRATSGGRELGHVLFSFDGEYLLPQDLEVEEQYRGQGIAQAMYDYVKSKGYKIRRSGQQTDAGAGFWNKHRAAQNVWEQDDSDVKSHDFMAGHCHVMALALKQLHPDWQIRAHVGYDDDEADDTEYRVDHVYTVAPDGTAYDCRGKFSNEQQLVGPDATGGVDTQYVNFGPEEIKQAMLRGELKRFSKQDLDNAMQVGKQVMTEETNPDCFDPAFNDTQVFDGLTYRATVDEEYGKPVLTIRVLDDNFQQAGLAKFKQSTRGVVSLITSFRPEYQGQGLARNIYAYVRAMGNTIVPSRNQLPPGKAMWDSWKKSGDAKHLMKDVAEGWKDQVAGAALVGAMALGGAGGAQAGNDSTNAGHHNLPDIVARITMTVNSKTIEKEINLGTQYQSPMAAKQAVAKWLEEKGVKNYTINLERVKSVDEGQQVVSEKIFVSEDAVMGKIEDGGKIVRILKKQHSVPFSDEKDWLLIDTDPAKGNNGLGIKWVPATTRFEWVRPYRETVDENFADGRHPEDKGDSQRHGIPKGATMAELEKASHAKGRKGQLARWQLNMRRGKKKTNETVIGNLHFPRLSIAVDDHAIDRTRTRGISPASIDQSLRKLNSIADQLGQMESSNTVWVYDVSNNLALGLRRTSSRDMRFTLKTVIAARPFDGPTPVIELT